MKLKITALILVLVMALGLMAGCGKDAGTTTGAADDGKMAVKIILVLEDKTEKTYDIRVTKDSNLRDALLEAELITEEEHAALFVSTIDGHTADFMQGYTWLVTNENDEQIQGFMEEIILEDGQTIKLTHYMVPQFD